MYQAFCEDPAFHNLIKVLSVSVCVCMVNITTFNEEGKEKKKIERHANLTHNVFKFILSNFGKADSLPFKSLILLKGREKGGKKT